MVSILLQGRKQLFVSENVSIDSFLANHVSTQMGHTSMKIVMSCQVTFIGKKRIDECIMRGTCVTLHHGNGLGRTILGSRSTEGPSQIGLCPGAEDHPEDSVGARIRDPMLKER